MSAIVTPSFFNNQLILDASFKQIKYDDIIYKEPVNFGDHHEFTLIPNAAIKTMVNSSFTPYTVRKIHGFDELNYKVVKVKNKQEPDFIDIPNSGTYTLYLNPTGSKRALNLKNKGTDKVSITPNNGPYIMDIPSYDHGDEVKVWLPQDDFDNIELYWINGSVGNKESSQCIIICKNPALKTSFAFRYNTQTVLDDSGEMLNQKPHILKLRLDEEVKGKGWIKTFDKFSLFKGLGRHFTSFVKNAKNKRRWKKQPEIFKKSDFSPDTIFNSGATKIEYLRVDAAQYHQPFKQTAYTSNKNMIKFGDLFEHKVSKIGKAAEKIYASHIYIKYKDRKAFTIVSNASEAILTDLKTGMHFKVYTFDNPKDIFDAKIQILDRKKFDNLPRAQIYAAVNLKAEKDFGVIHNLGAFAHDIKSVFK